MVIKDAFISLNIYTITIILTMDGNLMNKRIIFNVIFVILIFILLNLYIGFNGWIYLDNLFNKTSITVKLTYWIIFWFFTFSYILSRLLKKKMPRPIFRLLHKIGAYWIAVFYYLLLILVAVDIIGWGVATLSSLHIHTIILWLGTFVLISLMFLIVKGRKNALNTKVVHYDLQIQKKNDAYKELSIVLISDLHLSTLVTNKRLKYLVEKINTLSPHLVLIAGDIIDEDITPFVEENMVETLKKLTPKIGTFAVPGNHDYYGGHLEILDKHLKDAGITFLLDDYRLINDSFYILGRKDLASKKRLELHELMEGLNQTKPIILLDHQPKDLELPTKLGVDLQVSGHTHRGQFMPNHLITRKIFELDWGHLQKGVSHFIVSSGFGTWGPPIRNGNPSEMVSIHITFE